MDFAQQPLVPVPLLAQQLAQQLRSDKLMSSKLKLRRAAITRVKRRWRILFTVVRMNTVYSRVIAKRRRARQIIIERILVVTNFVVEVASAGFDQLSFQHKASFILPAMVLSFAALLICIGELVYRDRKARVVWQWRNKIPWFYHPSLGKRPFGSVTDIVGLVCAILQCIFNAITYVLYGYGINNPIQLAIMPPIFAFCVMCSKILQKNCDDDNASTEIPHSRTA